MPASAEGIGLGLRYDLARELLERQPETVAWLEIHPENYMERGGQYEAFLDRARERWPILTHGLTMCFGATEPFQEQYLESLKSFLAELEAPWHSDHLCVGGANDRFFHDLLPLPFTEEAVRNATQRLVEARDALDLPLAVENVSYYAAQAADGLLEADFVREVLERADAKLLLDVNNIYVNSQNFDFDPRAYIDRLPLDRVVQIHVAGHQLRDDGLRIDTHGEPVPEPVYELLEYALTRLGPVPVLLERDNKIPPLDELLSEIDELWTIYRRAIGNHVTR